MLLSHLWRHTICQTNFSEELLEWNAHVTLFSSIVIVRKWYLYANMKINVLSIIPKSTEIRESAVICTTKRWEDFIFSGPYYRRHIPLSGTKDSLKNSGFYIIHIRFTKIPGNSHQICLRRTHYLCRDDVFIRTTTSQEDTYTVVCFATCPKSEHNEDAFSRIIYYALHWVLEHCLAQLKYT